MVSSSARALLALLLALAGGCALPPPIEQGPPGPVPDAGMRPQVREFVMQALALLGTPYRYGGSSPDTGFDCSGLVKHVARKVTGLQLPADSRAISQYGAPVERTDIRPGDLVFFNTLRRSYSHVGIYLGDERFVHAPSSGGVVEIVDMRQRYWRQRYDGARRLPL